ncbi:hypothetical protein [Nonomuraea typhae]|uniref:Uncharacterized protein n=1 Tax=Nonomuraea typhae TaxID=2603600 RepID=A0ABW7YNB1_9ACTN
MTSKLPQAKTPSTAIARVLRALGLTQGQDFSLYGLYNDVTKNGVRTRERYATAVSLRTPKAESAVWEHAEKIEQGTHAEGWGFVIRLRKTDKDNMYSFVSNFGTSNVAEVRAASQAIAAAAQGLDEDLPTEPPTAPESGVIECACCGMPHMSADIRKPSYCEACADEDCEGTHPEAWHCESGECDGTGCDENGHEQARNKPVITIDLVETGRVTGWVDFSSYGDDFPVAGREENGEWLIYAGLSDEYNANGASLAVAVRRLAESIGLTGTAKIGNKIKHTEKIISLSV